MAGREVEADQERAAHRGRWAVAGARRRCAFHSVEEAPLCLVTDEAVETELASEVVVQGARRHSCRSRHVGSVHAVERGRRTPRARGARACPWTKTRLVPTRALLYNAHMVRRNSIMEEAMKLEFLNTPTRDLQAPLALYRDELGWEEAWREGDSVVCLKVPGSDVQLMLVAEDGAESAFGPIFVLDDVKRFHAQRPRGLRVMSGPQEIPGGYLATFEDPSGNTIYVMDQSLDAAGATTEMTRGHARVGPDVAERCWLDGRRAARGAREVHRRARQGEQGRPWRGLEPGRGRLRRRLPRELPVARGGPCDRGIRSPGTRGCHPLRGRGVAARRRQPRCRRPRLLALPVGVTRPTPDYGYLWWVTPIGTTPAYSAIGLYGQLAVVVPARELVVAISNGSFPPASSPEGLLLMVQTDILPRLP